MSRMKRAFAEMKARGEKILVSYFPIGDSYLADTVDWARRFFETGTSVLEIGLPYEDPFLDGPVVRDAMDRALSRIDLDRAFDEIRQIREAFPDSVLQPMTYMGNVHKYGYERFAAIMAACDVDAVLVPNATTDELDALDRVLRPYGIDNLRFIPYRVSQDMIEDLQKNGSGYVYLQAVDGATGSSAEITDQVKRNATLLRDAGIDLPMLPGFGISTPEHVRKYISMGLDGVIVGSAIIKHILAGDGEPYLRSLRDALNRNG
ncbi:MAG: tryptophan synthase subunit alpha [Clostridia bacterium]|nr:tryptophan synthase subunit alpha [Clostridia bacterium]